MACCGGGDADEDTGRVNPFEDRFTRRQFIRKVLTLVTVSYDYIILEYLGYLILFSEKYYFRFYW